MTKWPLIKILTKWHQEQKYIRDNNMSFLNKELSSAQKKEHSLEIVISKKELIKIKSFIPGNQIFVLLYYGKLKKSTMLS